MRAAIYKGDGKPWVIENLPDPEPGSGELLLKVHRCGICGTDLTMTRGTQWDFPAGTVPGHEYAGEVVAVGPDVADFKAGDRITSLPSDGCGRLECLACRAGVLTLCRDAPGVMGGFGEYIRVPRPGAPRSSCRRRFPWSMAHWSSLWRWASTECARPPSGPATGCW